MPVDYILDASALLALIGTESGFEKVARILCTRHTAISSVNYAEVAGKLYASGRTLVALKNRCQQASIDDVVPFDEDQADTCGILKASSRPLGLSPQQ